MVISGSGIFLNKTSVDVNNVLDFSNSYCNDYKEYCENKSVEQNIHSAIAYMNDVDYIFYKNMLTYSMLKDNSEELKALILYVVSKLEIAICHIARYEDTEHIYLYTDGSCLDIVDEMENVVKEIGCKGVVRFSGSIEIK